MSQTISLSSGSERITSLSENLHQAVSEISSSKVKSENGMREDMVFIDWNVAGDTTSGVKDNTSGSTRSVEGECCLNGHVHGMSVEGFKHDRVIFSLLTLGLRGASVRRAGYSSGTIWSSL